MKNLFGEEVYARITSLCKEENICEIRVRLHQKILVKTFTEKIFIDYICREDYLKKIISTAVHGSFYAYEKEISQGYIDYENGIRIGIVGSGKYTNNQIGYKQFYSLCIRFPHIIHSSVSKLGNFYQPFHNTIVTSPPYGGKTTLIRDMAKILADKYDTLIIDERNEICGKNLLLECGKRADVLQGVEKEHAYEGIIRSMSPEIVVCDELFTEKDFEAIRRISEAGILCLASYHCLSNEELPQPLQKIFKNRIILSPTPVPGTLVSYRRGCLCS